jgi:hypothetical protein
VIKIDQLRAIYPSLTEKERLEVSENLKAYFLTALRIAQSISDRVDKCDRPDTIEERSNSSLENT